MTTIRTAALIVIALLAMALAPAHARPAEADPRASLDRPFRAIWVTRWDYLTPEDVDRVIRDCAAAGFTDVFWQVRGQADAYYRSELEPWGHELFRESPTGPYAYRDDPGFDPLERAIERAGMFGIRIHAWINVIPLWRGTEPPVSRSHPLHRHPRWRLYDQDGKPQALNDHYVIVNPVLEEVQDHIVAVAADIVSRYRVDGLHLDYIRFVSETMGSDRVFPGDERSMAEFRRATGHRGLDTDEAREAFNAWKRDRITGLVRRLRDEAAAERPNTVLSAAVWRRPEIARETYLQDSARWLREGLIHLALPMIYSTDDRRYEGDIDAWRNAVGDLPLIPGVGVYQHADGAQTVRQVRYRGSLDRFALFAYSSLFESADPNQDRTDKGRRERRARLDPILEAARP